MQADMTTIEGQTEHYRAVDARVTAATIKARAIMRAQSEARTPQPAPLPEPMREDPPMAAPNPALVNLLYIAHDCGPRSAKHNGIVANSDRDKWKEIVLAVRAKHALTIAELWSARKKHKFVMARHEAWWLAARLTKLSTPLMGRMSGDRDHTTVLSGIRKHQWRLDQAARAT